MRPPIPPDSGKPSIDRTTLPLSGLRVLAVEDHEIGRALLEAMLTPLGVRATLVPDGLSALRAAEAEPFDVILIDLGLPDVAGEDLAVRLTHTRGGRDARIVALTGRARPSELPPPFRDWLEKPHSVRELDACLMAARPAVAFGA